MIYLRKKIQTLFLLAVIASLVSGCHFVVLDPKGMIAADERYYLIVSVILMLLVIIPVILLTLAFAYYYRESNTKAKYRPEFTHSAKLEIILWGIPCLIIAILAVLTWISSHKLDPYKRLSVPGKTLKIQAIALQWRWLFIYPEQHIATVDFVDVPVNVPVDFYITSSGPMNSFQVPQLAGQIYAMAGMRTQMNLIANAPGDYRGVSANYTGYGFADMRFTVHAGSQDSFNQWVQAVKKSPSESLDMALYNQLAKPTDNNVVQYFKYVDSDLFDNVVMKESKPTPVSSTGNM